MSQVYSYPFLGNCARLIFALQTLKSQAGPAGSSIQSGI
jgi:hypothetical protein